MIITNADPDPNRDELIMVLQDRLFCWKYIRRNLEYEQWGFGCYDDDPTSATGSFSDLWQFE